MARFQELPPTFYVFYSDDSATKLSIPTPAVKEHRDFLCQIFVNLTTESGLSWDVEIEKIDGGYFFTDGWSEFVKDNDLVERNLLLFHIIGNSTFRVSVLGDNCWFEPPRLQMAAATLRFVKKLKKYHFTNKRLNIPKSFAEGTGIAMSGRVVLETDDGREWPINVTGRGARMYSMTGGWVNFLRGNNLRIGNVLLFELVPASNNVVKVVAMEREAGEELLSQANLRGLL